MLTTTRPLLASAAVAAAAAEAVAVGAAAAVAGGVGRGTGPAAELLLMGMMETAAVRRSRARGTFGRRPRTPAGQQQAVSCVGLPQSPQSPAVHRD